MPFSKGKPNLRLRDERLRRHLSQQQLADLLGTTLNTVSRWERRITDCSPYFRKKLCEIFEKDARDLGLTQEVDESIQAPDYLFDPFIPANCRLVGRNASLQDIKQKICDQHGRKIIALTGLPGVGKSALAIALAHDSQVKEYFQDGILWANLGPNFSLSSVLSHWKTLLQASEEMDDGLRHLPLKEQWILNIRAAIGERQILVIIDDLWQIEDALLLMHVGGPNCSFVLTTRFTTLALHIADAIIFPVQELEVKDGLQLLKNLAPFAVRTQHNITSELIRIVGGLPLAITLIGQYLRMESHNYQPRRLNYALEQLQNTARRLQLALPECSQQLPTTTSRSLQAAIAVSEQALNEEAKKALRDLSVFPPKPNTFSEDGALAVINNSVDVIDHLCDAGLLESAGPGRYSLHQCIADYALLYNNDRSSEERLIEYITTFVRKHRTCNSTLKRENSNILAALELAYKRHRISAQVEIAVALFHFVDICDFPTIVRDHLQDTLQSIQTVDDAKSFTQMLFHLGKIDWMEKNVCGFSCKVRKDRDSKEYIHQQLHAKRSYGQKICAFSANDTMFAVQSEYYASLLDSVNNYVSPNPLDRDTDHTLSIEEMKADLQKGFQIAKEQQDDEVACALLANLAAIAQRQNLLCEAHAFVQEGFQIAKNLEQKQGLALMYLQKIHLLFYGERFDEAGNTLYELLTLFLEKDIVAAMYYYSLILVAYIEPGSEPVEWKEHSLTAKNGR